MSVPVHVVGPDALRIAEDADVSNWADALAAGDCTPDEFLNEILRQEQGDPDAGWEALALVDQLYRRHRIDHDVFRDLKARLHQSFLPSSAEISRPATFSAPMVATRVATLVDIPVITTTLEAPTPPAPTQTAPHPELQAGDQLCRRYRVVDILRRSSSSTLVEAVDELKIEMPGARRRVAIEVMDETLSRDPKFLNRIGKVQGLYHPAIARLFDVDEENGALLLVKELLNGPSLRDLHARNKGGLLHASFARTTLSSIAGALGYAHSQGVTHGNVNTANVFITQAGDIRLQGFECASNPVDPAADRLAFARLAYELLTGTQVSHTTAGHASRIRQPPGLTNGKWRLLRDTLNGKGTRGNVLTEFAGNPPRESRRGPWLATACIAAFLGAGAWLLGEEDSEIQDIAAAPAVAAPDVVSIPAPAPVPTGSDTIPQPITPAIAPVVVPARSRIDLSVTTATVETTARVARIWVRRRDNLSGAVTFQWWTESGSAEEDRDFRRIAPRTETIPDGANGIEVLVPLIPDADRRESRAFYVKIDEPGPRATLGSRTLMQVSIVPSGP